MNKYFSLFLVIALIGAYFLGVDALGMAMLSMMTPYRPTCYNPAKLSNIASAGLIGTSVPYDDWETTYPWEWINIWLTITANATAPSSLTVDGVLGALRNVRLEVSEPNQKARAVVNTSGIFLLEMAQQIWPNMDTATLALIGEHTKGTPALTASNIYRLCYHLPLTLPFVTEPLKTRTLLPVHQHTSAPKLVLDFSTAAQMYGAGTIDAMVCELEVMPRYVPPALDAEIAKSGGYIPWDLIETPFTIATGVTSAQRIKIPSPGWYANLLVRQYLGGSSLTRVDVSSPTTAGSEPLWTIEMGGSVEQKFKPKFVMARNQRSRPLNMYTQTVSPTIAGKPITNSQFCEPASFMLDFLSDGFADVSELGSALDCNIPQNTNLKKEMVIASVSNVATNGSIVYTGGYRFYDNQQGTLLAPWQKLRAAGAL